jgi:fructokinase
MKGVLCLGEALIDFIPLDQQNLTYQKAPGGAPANVAVGIAKLGGASTFLGKVGNDVLGHFLKETLQNYGVNTEAVLTTDEARTGLVFVTLEPSGERHFSFYIHPSADRFLREEDLLPSLFDAHSILHFGSISMISEPSRSATLRAVQMAKEKGMTISFDPNLRLGLWDSKESAKNVILSMLPFAHVLKVSEEELQLLTDCADYKQGICALDIYEIPLVLVTLGGEGSLYRSQGKMGSVPAMKCQVVDTTGAGDAYVSGILFSLYESGTRVENLSEGEFVEMIRFATVSGGLATTKKGAMTGLPSLADIRSALSRM